MNYAGVMSVLILLPAIALAENVVPETALPVIEDTAEINLADETGEATTSTVETSLISNQTEECTPTTIGKRYLDNDNGTVTDKRTCLIWLKDMSCLDKQNWVNAKNQICRLNAKENCQMLDTKETEHEDIALECQDYTIGTFEDWRLPSVQELVSVLNYDFYNPVLSNAMGHEKWGIEPENDAFSSVELDLYWSSTTSATSRTHAWHIRFTDGNISVSDKERAKIYVLPVRSQRQ